MKPSFRNGFYAGLLVAFGLGLYLFQLWQPERQLRLHSAHLLEALEQSDWEDAKSFIAETYQDQWGHDRALALSRLREVLQYTRELQIDAQETGFGLSAEEGTWSARIRIEAEPNEVTIYLKERVNVVEEPFELSWRRQSWKPWDWKLTRVSNSAIELPTGGY